MKNTKSIDYVVVKCASLSGATGLLLTTALSGNPFNFSRVVILVRTGEVVPQFICEMKNVKIINAFRFGSTIFSRILVFLTVAVDFLYWRLLNIQSTLVNVIAGSEELAFALQLSSIGGKRKLLLFSDLTSYHLSPRMGFILSWVEKYLIDSGWAYVVTSPAFISGYLVPKTNRKPRFFYVTNAAIGCEKFAISIDSSYVKADVKIVWAGLLRCSKSLEILTDSASGFVKDITLAGSTEHLDENLLDKIKYIDKFFIYGRYVNEDLPKIYSGGHYTWCCDWELGLNSVLLLANRLFQGIAMGVPIIASKGSAMAEVVHYYELGFSINPTSESLQQELNAVTPSVHARWVSNCIKYRQHCIQPDGGWVDIIESKATSILADESSLQIFGPNIV